MSKITDNMEVALKDADYVWVTVPAQVFPIIAKKMDPCVKKGQKVGIIPGFGGAEFSFEFEIKKEMYFFWNAKGTQHYKAKGIWKISLPIRKKEMS